MSAHQGPETGPARLPPELLLKVADNLHSSADISSFSRVNSFLHRYLQPKLYHFNVEQQNYSALYWAAAHDVPGTAEMCLQAGASVDYEEERMCLYNTNMPESEAFSEPAWLTRCCEILGTSPLHVASSYGSVKVMEVLVKHGADVELGDRLQQSSLYLASELGKDEAVAFLLDKGANIQAEGLHNQSPLHAATCGGFVSTVQLLLDRGADPSRPSQNGYTPLHEAIAYRCHKIAEMLINYGTDIEAMASMNTTPLRHAIEKGSSHMVSLLLAAGAEVNGSPRTRPLHDAIKHNQVPVIKELLEYGADVNAVDEFSRRPMLAAVVSGNLAVIDMLVEHGADLGPGSSASGRKAELLFSAVQCNRLEVIERLIRYGLDPYERNADDQSAYQYAKERGMVELAKQLRQYSGSRSKPGFTPFASRFKGKVPRF